MLTPARLVPTARAIVDKLEPLAAGGPHDIMAKDELAAPAAHFTHALAVQAPFPVGSAESCVPPAAGVMLK